MNGHAGCTSYIDLLFIVDVSGSIQFERINVVREFLVSIVADLDVGPTATRVGAVYFSNDSHVAFHLDQYTTRQDVQEAIRYIPYIGAKTNIAAGLRKARTDLLQASTALHFSLILILFYVLFTFYLYILLFIMYVPRVQFM